MKLSTLFFYFAFFVSPLWGAPLTLTRQANLDGAERWDYLTVEPSNHKLYISRSNYISVVDTQTLKEVAKIPGLDGAHGIAIAPSVKHGFATSGKTNTVIVFDTDHFKVLASLKTGQHPDAILYDPFTDRIFTFNAGKSMTAIDPKQSKVIDTVSLPGKPEFAVSDHKGTLFVNLENMNSMAKIHADTLKVESVYSISPCESPTGLAMDIENRRLFSACENHLLEVTNADTGKPVTSIKIGDGPDAAAYDPTTKLIFTSNGKDATISVLEEKTPDHFENVESIQTKKGAKTMALDETTHNLYLVTADYGAAPNSQPHARPPVLPGSVKLFVYSPKGDPKN